MSTLTCHVLDLGAGKPAAAMRVALWRWRDEDWRHLTEETTNENGRIGGFGHLDPGRYRLGFETGEWGHDFYPFVHVVFEVSETDGHYHIPLLLSPFGYSTYRGG